MQLTLIMQMDWLCFPCYSFWLSLLRVFFWVKCEHISVVVLFQKVLGGSILQCASGYCYLLLEAFDNKGIDSRLSVT